MGLKDTRTLFALVVSSKYDERDANNVRIIQLDNGVDYPSCGSSGYSELAFDTECPYFELQVEPVDTKFRRFGISSYIRHICCSEQCIAVELCSSLELPSEPIQHSDKMSKFSTLLLQFIAFLGMNYQKYIAPEFEKIMENMTDERLIAIRNMLFLRSISDLEMQYGTMELTQITSECYGAERCTLEDLCAYTELKYWWDKDYQYAIKPFNINLIRPDNSPTHQPVIIASL